ncbi:MAG: hypothetical protein KDA72_17015 [Planctomycetales bacterium]|nr:hypothetical protein [Planctomycetales bacterium]
MTATLGNGWFTGRFIKVVLLLVVAESCVSAPLTGRLLAADAADRAAEYEEWGLEPPASPKESQVKSQSSTPQPPASPAKGSRSSEGPPVPADLAARLGQAAVLIVAVMDDGKEFHTVGWIVDQERRIVMTSHPLVAVATKVFVAYPQLPGAEKGSLTGAPAILMRSPSHPDIAYLQVESELPVSLPTLTVAGSRAQPIDAGQTISSGDRRERGGSSQGTDASHRNPLVGQWYLQDDVGDYGLTMLARFDEQGGFRMDTIALDLFGSEDREAVVGTYLVRGNTLFLQTNEGPLQAQFKFEDGYLVVMMPDGVVTFTFERVEES